MIKIREILLVNIEAVENVIIKSGKIMMILKTIPNQEIHHKIGPYKILIMWLFSKALVNPDLSA